MSATFATIMKDLKARKFSPIYLLMGEEPYYIDKITKYIQDNVLTEAEQSFNQSVLYGKDTDVYTLDNVLRRFPMMSEYQVVILKEAQNLKKIDELVHYASKPSLKTIFVINHKYKSLPKNKKLYKALSKSAVIFESKKLYENKIPDWINAYLSEKKCKISPKASSLLTEFLGTDLGKIAHELDKLLLIIQEGETITPEHIETNIGISKDFNIFELQNAIAAKNHQKGARIVQYFNQSPKDHPIVVTITSLYFYFVKILSYHYVKNKDPRNVASELKINPFFVKDYQKAAGNYPIRKVVEIISLLRIYDLKTKGVNNASTPQDEIMRELIFKIMH